MKVLITGAGALLGQGLIRAVRSSSLGARIVAVDPNPLAVGLYWADAAHLVPMAADPSYHDAILRLLQSEKPDAILVGTDPELAYFARQRAAFERDFGTHVVVSEPEVVAIADDKWLTFQFLQRHGFACPDSVLPGEERALIERVGFPLVVKPRRGARSIGMSIVHSVAELAAVMARGSDLVVQECVATPADEHTSGLLCFDGRCVASITMRRDLRDGNTFRAFPLPDFPYDAELRRVVEKLGGYGPINLQFRVAGGRPKIFEINARFSGTTPLRGLVGFPEVEMVLRHLVLGQAIAQPRVRTDAVLRHWTETVVPRDRLLEENH
jgi:carbamoyl-phosphate synthase large subunit